MRMNLPQLKRIISEQVLTLSEAQDLHRVKIARDGVTPPEAITFISGFLGVPDGKIRRVEPMSALRDEVAATFTADAEEEMTDLEGGRIIVSLGNATLNGEEMNVACIDLDGDEQYYFV